MKHYNTDTDETTVNSTPLFASVWMALFYVLRRNYNDRRALMTADADCADAIEKQ